MGTSPCRAIASTSATPSKAPPTAPADTSMKGRIGVLSTPLLRSKRRRGADDVAGALPVRGSLGQLAPRPSGEDKRFFHVADIVPKLGGGQGRHRLILEHAIGLGRLVPSEGIIVFHQNRGL